MASLIFCLSACSSHKITSEQLSSQFRALASCASESELLIEQVQRGKLTDVYAHAFLSYLAHTVLNAVQEVRKAVPSSGLEASLAECRRQGELLLSEIEHLSEAMGRPASLEQAKLRLDSIRASSEKARDNL